MIKELTGGKSLAANIALVKHNAEIGAKTCYAIINQDIKYLILKIKEETEHQSNF